MDTMDNNFGKFIYNGKIIDFNKTGNTEFEQILLELKNEQVKKKNNIINILEKMSGEM